MKFWFSTFCLLICSCSYQIKIKTGDQAFQNKQYSIAQSLYLSEFDQSDQIKEKSYIAFKLGQSYKYVSDFGQSMKWFKIAYDLNYGLKALEEYAFSLKNNGEYEAAIQAFEELSNEVTYSSEIRKEITICKLNIQWKSQRDEFYYHLRNYTEINELSSDYSAVKDPLGLIYFVSDRLNESVTSKVRDSWTGRYFSDIYSYSAESGIQNFGRIINSGSSEGPFSFNSKMNELFFTRCEDRYETENFCRIFYSIKRNNIWSEPEEIDFGLSSGNQVHPALHFSDSILIFSSDDQTSIGQYDLYISYRSENQWSKAVNMGDIVNTANDEKFPVWYRDTLFFSSTGHPGMGGLDVFKTYQSPDRRWYPPLNVKPGINSEADDFGLFIDTSFIPNDSIFQKALLSSNRGNMMNDDIYLLELRKRTPPSSDTKKPKFKLEIIANIQFISHEFYHNNKLSYLDSVDVVEKVSKRSVSTKSASKLSLKLLAAENYTFVASKRGYLNKQDSTILLNIEVELIPVHYDAEFILKELYYDFDEWSIREDAIPALDNLKSIMITNPGIKILLGSHTDCRGEENYNLNLSSKRAKSAMDWLVQNGISSNRLQYKGYGEQNPSVQCKCEDCSESEHQLNRRTTFKIIKE
jgi:peptidoglycan-associated lipoprotein